jgi:subtilisin family serine protease
MKTPEKNIPHRLNSKTLRARALSLSVCLMLVFSAISLLQAKAAPQGIEAKFSSDVFAQLQSLMEEKASRTPTQRKISSRLLYSSKINRGLRITDKVATFRSALEPEPDGKVLVDIRAWTSGGVDIEDDLRRELESQDVEILTAVEGSIQARMRLDLVEEIAELPEIISVREAAQYIVWSTGRISPTFNSRADRLRSNLPALVARARQVKSQDGAQSYSPAVTNRSEGDTAHRAGEARNFYGYNGAGIKIGVISDGVDSLAALQSTGDLPPTVTVLPGQAGTGDEGCAMLEIVYDLVPGAQLYFATVAGGIANFAKNIRDLRSAGCDIIVDDVAYLNETSVQDGQANSVISPFNGGLPLQAVKDVTSDGALYLSSAGNAGNKNDGTSSTYEGDFRPIVSGSLMLHDWGGGPADPTNRVTTAGARAVLQWSDPLGQSSNDYDLIVVNSAGTSIVDLSADIQDGNDDPLETVVGFPSERILVNLFSGNARFLSMRMFGGGRLNFNTEGAVFGHNSAANAFAVAAVDIHSAHGPGAIFDGAETVEPFSSDGPRRFLFNADGSQITPGNVSATGGLLRQKPDIAAADGVMCAAPGFNPFFGTSAAAPHAAAIAALIRSASSSSTLQTISANRVKSAMLSSALGIEAPGTDRDSGAGIVMALQAMQAANAIPLPEVTGAFVSGKHLIVEGRFFDNGTKIFMDGVQRTTKKVPENPTTQLKGKKLAKKISTGQTVVLTVRTSGGLASRNEFRFTKP